MLKKITALFLISAFTHVYAVTPIQQSAIADELSRTYDELNYKLNVEWDQKDAKFFDQTIEAFEKEISALQRDGLSTQELVQHALGKIKDKQIQNDVNELARVVSESQMGPDEARSFIISKLSSTYSHGASWSGHRGHRGTAVLIGAIVVCLLIYYHNTQNEPTPVVINGQV